ncbi:MAG: hypothetical protein C0618_01115 [Desulfuromonas sp.]|nr:MAG: hypothetical protein C0618_01115 [Desulfuromonas sp.]
MEKLKLFVFVLLVTLMWPTIALAHGGPGLFELRLFNAESGDKGLVKIYNSPKVLHVKILPDGWLIEEVQIYAGEGFEGIPLKKNGRPACNVFPFKTESAQPSSQHDEVIQLDDLGFSWGVKGQPIQTLAVHVDLVKLDPLTGEVIAKDSGWAQGPNLFEDVDDAWWLTYELTHPMRGQFIDSPVQGLSYSGPTQQGTTGYDEDGSENDQGGFSFFPDERVSFAIGSIPLGTATASNKVSPLDLFPGASLDDPRVVGVARLLQSLDADQSDGKIELLPAVVSCFEEVVADQTLATIDFGDAALIDLLITATVDSCNGAGGAELLAISASDAKANLENGISLGGIFRKNISKEADFAVDSQKLEVMPVYFPGVRSDGSASYCDLNGNDVYDPGEEGVPYEEWRLNGNPEGEGCDPRVDSDGNGTLDAEDNTCVVTLIECREVAKPIISTYMEKVDLFDEKVTTDFPTGRFSYDIVTAISRDDGSTWKRMNVSRMADLSSFELETTGKPFPGTCNKPQLKVIDNKILVVWVSAYARGGNPRYAITTCDDPDTAAVETPATGCQIVCAGPDDPTDPNYDATKCAPDYQYDDDYFVNDIWGVRGQQGSVNYDEVDDVADLGIGEVPYSALWAARGVIVTQADLESGKFNSLIVVDDPNTVENEAKTLAVGDVVWFKPERLTSGRRDAYIPVVGGTRGAGFAIAWQEDPSGLRPGKGKGPGEGWSGAIANHKTDIWYSYILPEDFDLVDGNFVPGGDPDEEAPGVGRPKFLVPFSLPVRISDNDMLNTDTLKVVVGDDGLPEINGETESYTPVDPEDVEHGNANGTKRYAYLAKTDPLYEYYWDKLDLCDTSGTDAVLTELPGTDAHERWYRFTNTEGTEKTVCISSDGRLIDGDVSASRPNMQLQPYTKTDGTKSAWVLLSYEESKGMGHSLDAGHADTDNPLPDLISDKGQDKPIKQDLGKNVIYHSFDYTQPELVSAGHIVNLPALCGGLYPNYCDDNDNPTCSCTAGEPIPLYFEDQQDDGSWLPNSDNFMQYRTEIARRTRFISQSYGRMIEDGGTTGTIGTIIYKQGQEGQGRPADVFIRRIVVPDTVIDPATRTTRAFDKKIDNPYAFSNFECLKYLDETFGGPGYNNNVWGQPSGDRLCGGIIETPYPHRDHVNLTSADIDLSVDAGPDDDTPDDPTDDIYGTDKVLLWSQHPYNLGDESYGGNMSDDTSSSIAGMFSNGRSHRGFIRGDFLVTAYAWSPNWAAARNGRDRYNFYLRKSFDGGQTWTTTPASFGGNDGIGQGINYCREWRSDPEVEDPDGSGNLPPAEDTTLDPPFDPECVAWCAPDDLDCTVTGMAIGAGEFEPAVKVSEFDNNQETSADPRIGATPPVRPLDGRDAALKELSLVEDEYLNNTFFVAWGAGENQTSTGGTTITPEAPPTDVYYTRSTDYGDHFLKVPWEVMGENSNYADQTVWRYERLAWGEEEQGECQLRATSDGSKMYGIYHQMIPAEEDPDVPVTRWYPWELEESHEDDIWFRRVIFWPETDSDSTE